MHELDPSYLGYLGPGDVSALLDALLAAEWGRAVPDEARLRAALRLHLEGSRHGSIQTPSGPPACGGDQPARMIREALPRIHGDALRRDLEDVLRAIEQRDHQGTG